jgi:hypothetical protein
VWRTLKAGIIGTAPYLYGLILINARGGPQAYRAPSSSTRCDDMRHA